MVYELDQDLKPIKHYYLATDEELKAKLEAVANQGKVKKPESVGAAKPKEDKVRVGGGFCC